MNLLREEKQNAMVLSEQRENNMEKLVLVKFANILVIQMVQEFFGEFWFSALEEWRQIISTNLSVVFGSVFITLEKIQNSFLCSQAWPTVNNNPSRKRSFSKML